MKTIYTILQSSTNRFYRVEKQERFFYLWEVDGFVHKKTQLVSTWYNYGKIENPTNKVIERAVSRYEHLTTKGVQHGN